MSGIVGANVEQVESLARRFEASSKKLSELLNRASFGIMVAEWTGADIDRLRAEWNRQAKPSITRSAIALKHIGASLDTQAGQQREASTVKSGFGRGGPFPGLFEPGSGWGPDGFNSQIDKEGYLGLRGSDEGSYHFGPVYSQWKTNGLAGVEGGIDSSISIGSDHLNLNTTMGGRAGVGGYAEAESGIDGVSSSKSFAEGFIGVGANASNHFNIDENGFSGGQAFDASAGAGGTIGIKSDVLGVTNETSLEGFAGARLAAEATAAIGPDGISARAGFDGMAGAAATVKQDISLGGFLDIGGSASVSAGVGANAGIGFDLGPEKIGFDLHLGGKLGIGGGFSLNISINPKKIGKAILSIFGF